jgi:hypothetical protein
MLPALFPIFLASRTYLDFDPAQFPKPVQTPNVQFLKLVFGGP